jgi:flagellar biosynthesis protein FlhB
MSEKGTEQASPQRKRKAIEAGDGVRSREVLSATAMLGGVLVLGAVVREFRTKWEMVFAGCLATLTRHEIEGQQGWIAFMYHAVVPIAFAVFMVGAASFGCAAVAGVAQSGGLRLQFKALELKPERLNPGTNLQNIFSLRSATRLTKSLVPVSALLVLSWGALKSLMTSMPVMSAQRMPTTFSAAYRLVLYAAWIMLAWSGLDYAMEWKSWNDRLKMTKQQVREEVKESVGNPLVKGKIRQIQRALRRKRAKADISRASVVITNPTHYAVALEFSFETMQAPVVLAKGRDLHAAEIREQARWAGVPIVENPPLARSLYRLVEPGAAIPIELYSAVAGILAYLYRQQAEQRTKRHEGAQRNAYQDLALGMRGFGGGM